MRKRFCFVVLALLFALVSAYSQTPSLIKVICGGSPEAIQATIDNGANLNARDSFYGATALHRAAMYNANPEVVAMLLKAGADINARSTLESMTALMWATIPNPHPETIITLLNAGADATLRDKNGKTALDYAKANDALKGTEVLKSLEEASQ
jgi:ankyrin repeat protein